MTDCESLSSAIRRCMGPNVIFALVLVACWIIAPWAGPLLAAEPDPAELYARGSEAYREARYEEAVDLLRAAHRIEPHPELAYDLGRAYEGAGDLPHAIESFREYL